MSYNVEQLAVFSYPAMKVMAQYSDFCGTVRSQSTIARARV